MTFLELSNIFPGYLLNLVFYNLSSSFTFEFDFEYSYFGCIDDFAFRMRSYDWLLDIKVNDPCVRFFIVEGHTININVFYQ